MRAVGGTLYIIGMFVLVYNITKRLEQNASIEDELAKPP
jgi:cytochrome c oxidase cbb3-type subunit I/II